MRNKVQPIWFALLVLGVLTIFNGCSTTDYYRLKQTRMDVDFAMTRFQNRVAFDGLASAYQPQVNSAYQAYKTAFDAAARQAHANYDAPTPNNVKQLADQLLSLLGSIPNGP
jgi:hypothetical protein